MLHLKCLNGNFSISIRIKLGESLSSSIVEKSNNRTKRFAEIGVADMKHFARLKWDISLIYHWPGTFPLPCDHHWVVSTQPSHGGTRTHGSMCWASPESSTSPTLVLCRSQVCNLENLKSSTILLKWLLGIFISRKSKDFMETSVTKSPHYIA